MTQCPPYIRYWYYSSENILVYFYNFYFFTTHNQLKKLSNKKFPTQTLFSFSFTKLKALFVVRTRPASN